MSLLELMEEMEMPEKIIINDETSYCLEDAEIFIQNFIDKAKSINPKYSIHYDMGLTQICIWNDTNFAEDVIKIPFTHYYDEDLHKIEPLLHNYTEVAVELSKKVKEENLNHFFALVKIAGFTKNHKPIYTQTRCIPYARKKKSPRPSSPISFEIVDSISEKYENPFSEEWSAACVEAYGIQDFENLLIFVEENVSDMHEGNYGWDTNGLPIIFDFSGYME